MTIKLKSVTLQSVNMK